MPQNASQTLSGGYPRSRPCFTYEKHTKSMLKHRNIDPKVDLEASQTLSDPLRPYLTLSQPGTQTPSDMSLPPQICQINDR
jgi:hypothetical protein